MRRILPFLLTAGTWTLIAAPALAVSPEPTGPPKPSSGWSVVYADGFNAPFGTGTGQDNTWQLQNSNEGCCGNSNEPQAQRPRQVSITPEGVKESCTYRPEGVSAEGEEPFTSLKYECGGIVGAFCCTLSSSEPPGYNSPVFWTGKGQTFAFQAVLKLPPNTGLADPAFWADGPPWSESEMDFPEFYGATTNYTAGSDWEKASAYFVAFGSPHPELVKRSFSDHPDEGFHTYTFYVSPGSNPEKYRLSEYIDGQLQTLEGGSVSPEVSSVTEKLNLELDYALRDPVSSAATTAGGSYIARSVAIYEDTAHKGVGIEHGGLAPGTTIGSSEPPPACGQIPGGITTACYVSPTGSDSNNGGEAHPWRTIAHAAASTEGFVIVKPGTYAEDVTISHPLELRGYEQSASVRSLKVSGSHVHIENLTVSGSSGACIEVSPALTDILIYHDRIQNCGLERIQFDSPGNPTSSNYTANSLLESNEISSVGLSDPEAND